MCVTLTSWHDPTRRPNLCLQPHLAPHNLTNHVVPSAFAQPQAARSLAYAAHLNPFTTRVPTARHCLCNHRNDRTRARAIHTQHQLPVIVSPHPLRPQAAGAHHAVVSELKASGGSGLNHVEQGQVHDRSAPKTDGAHVGKVGSGSWTGMEIERLTPGRVVSLSGEVHAVWNATGKAAAGSRFNAGNVG